MLCDSSQGDANPST